MARRLLDILCALVALVLVTPLLLVAALGIRLASPGPVLFRTRRVGRYGRQFVMFKLRTMHQDHGAIRSRITGVADPRIFPFGLILRQTKIDELPQLVNILLGDMAFIGPRPEVPGVVARHYTPLHRETLNVRPGLSSPGSIYHYTIGEHALTGEDPEARYFDDVLPIKLAIDIVYVRRASFAYDLAVIARTISAIIGVLSGRRAFPVPAELAEARPLVMPARNTRIYSPSSLAEAKAASAPRPLAVPAPAVSLAAVLIAGALAGGCLGPEAPPIIVTYGDSVTSPMGYSGEMPPRMFMGTGNIARCGDETSVATAALLDRVSGTVFTTGDQVDTESDNIARCFDKSWGRHKSRIRPVLGDHESRDAYFRYFGEAAGPQGRGWYSYDIGGWHIVALNSTADMSEGSEQLAWLEADLAASRGRCTIAYWHHPRFASGRTHGDAERTQAVWDVLYAAGAEIVLNGHVRHYERFAQQDPDGQADYRNGIRQFIIGTGSSRSESFGITEPNSERRRAGTPGVLAFTLRDGAYDWRFIPVAGQTFVDEGSGVCHDAPRSYRRRVLTTMASAATDSRQP